MRAALWLLLPLAGCWVSESDLHGVIGSSSDTDTDTDTDVDTDTDADTDTDVAIVIDAVRPDYGTTAGGTPVIVEASPLDEEARVWFDAVEGTVTEVSGSQISVTTPPGVAGTATVRVESGEGEGELEEGFTYWTDGSGKTGVLGLHSWYHMVGDYWVDDPEDWGRTWIDFIEPTDVEVLDYLAPGLDRCERDYTFNWSAIEDRDLDEPRIQLLGPTGSKLVLLHNEDLGAWYEDKDLSVWDWSEESAWKLLPIGGDLPSFEVPEFMVTPSEFTLLDPVVTGEVADYVLEDLTLEWYAEGEGDYMVARLYRYQNDVLADTVQCAMIDDGSFTVPASAWSDWSLGDQLLIYVGRVRLSEAVLPHDQSQVQVGGVYWVVGGALQWY